MRRLRDHVRLGLVAIVGALFLGGLLPATALAADTRQGSSVTIGPGEVVNDDLYIAANNIDIQGTVNGNLFAAGNTITVSGVITRDMNVSGTSIDITGEVQGSARLAGTQVSVSGKVDGDLVAATGTLTLTGEGSIGRDVIAAGSTAAFAGPIARNVWFSGRDVVFSAPVGGNVTAYESTLRLDSGASIHGDLSYTSSQDAVIGSGAGVTGATHRSYPSNGPDLGSFLFGWLQTLVGFVLLGVLLIFAAPRFNGAALAACKLAPWSRLGIGLAVLFLVPIAAVLTFVAGLIVGGWWLGLLLAGAYALVLLTGFTLAGELIGRFVLDHLGQARAHNAFALIVGLVILLVLTSLPLVGWLFAFVVLIYGAGIVVMALPWGTPRTPRPAPSTTPTVGLARPAPTA